MNNSNRFDFHSVLVLVAWAWLACSILYGVAGCGDNGSTDTPDANTACLPPTDAGADDCCALYPDEDAVRACVRDKLPAGGCALLACPMPDMPDQCDRISVCNLPGGE